MNLLQVAKQSTEAYMARYFGQHVMDVQVDSDFMTADAVVAWTLNVLSLQWDLTLKALVETSLMHMIGGLNDESSTWHMNEGKPPK